MSKAEKSANDVLRLGGLPFVRANCLGNDFIIFDGRAQPLSLTTDQVQLLVDRHLGIAGDQVLTLLHSSRANTYLRIQNVDGREVNACGNATRCVARLLFDEGAESVVTIETPAAILTATRISPSAISVDLGAPNFDWRTIPLSENLQSDRSGLSWSLDGQIVVEQPMILSMGNPHAVYFVDDLAGIPVASIGSQLEVNPLFPQGANIGFVQVISRHEVRLRVWERGAGLTLACGTGSAAAVVAGASRGLIDRNVTVVLDGGELSVEWRSDDHVVTQGSTAIICRGELAHDLDAAVKTIRPA